MKFSLTLLMVTLILCVSGIASADMEEMINMTEVKGSALLFWDDVSSIGYLILGAALTITIFVIFGVVIIGAGQTAFGNKSKDANATNEGRANVMVAIGAAALLVIGIMVLYLVVGRI